MILNTEEIKVKGMERGTEYTSGNWFNPILLDSQDDSTVFSVGDSWSVDTGLTQHEYQTRELFARSTFNGGFRRLNTVAQLLGLQGYYAGQRLAESFWGRSQPGGLTEAVTGLHGLEGEHRSSIVRKLTRTVQEIDTARKYITQMCDTALTLAELIGLKLHPETIKAAQNYPDAYLARVQAAYGSTGLRDVRMAAYTSDNSDHYNLFTEWGTYFDDTVGCSSSNGSYERCQDMPERVAQWIYWATVEFLRAIYLVDLYFTNGRQALVGLGFQDTNPMFILGKFTPNGKFVTSAVRVGRYFSNFSHLVDFRDPIEDLKVLNKETKTYLCVTDREWFDAYKGGIDSCMTRSNFGESPVRIYATTSYGLPDNNLRLFVQYGGDLFGEGFRVLARAIVNIEKMQYVRAYGGNADAVLRAAGYTANKDCLDGCILAKVSGSHGYQLMVYSDGNQDKVVDHGTHWELSDYGDWDADTACGYLEGYEEPRECEHCGETTQVENLFQVEVYDENVEEWCHDCLERRTRYVRGRGYVTNTQLAQEEAEEV